MKIEFFNQMEKAQNVLLIGAGGGWDIFCGLPIYFWLRAAGKSVHLANLTFSNTSYSKGERPVPSLLEITSNSGGSLSYFPELYLAEWLSERFGNTPVYAIERAGVKPTVAAYDWLVKTFNPDTLVLIDGGTDSLMRGDEIGLGTPQEDMASLFAARAVTGIERKFLLSIGFGVDTYHGVCHAHFLENVSALIADDGYLGAWSLTKEMAEFQLYREACDYVAKSMPRHPSIVNTSVIAGAAGSFGDHHATSRTKGSELFINPLMAIYWAFQLEKVARRNLYLDLLGETETYQQLSLAIEAFQATLPKTRNWVTVPF